MRNSLPHIHIIKLNSYKCFYFQTESCHLLKYVLASKPWWVSSLGSFSAEQEKALQVLGNSDQTTVATEQGMKQPLKSYWDLAAQTHHEYYTLKSSSFSVPSYTVPSHFLLVLLKTLFTYIR